MKITPLRIRALIAELIDENPFACRALLQIVGIEFTEEVSSAAVSCEDSPRLLLNPVFLSTHCRTDAHVKAVICHEFLHVLLRHTERRGPQSDAEHLACDAVINAIIHRSLGEAYSGFMLRYYATEKGVARLLRPPADFEASLWGKDSKALTRAERTLRTAWAGLYGGKLVVDDIHALALDFAPSRQLVPAAGWLGDHSKHPGSSERNEGAGEESAAPTLSPAVVAALERALASMNGSGIWRSPQERGAGAPAYAANFRGADEALQRWRMEAWRVLRRHLLPDRKAPRTRHTVVEHRLPVLSTADRRAFARALWSPLLPEAAWPGQQPVVGESAQVYLDVSGSMNAEMPLIVALIARLGSHVRRPFWAFSDVVAPAVIRDGVLHADTTGGTSMRCVLQHLAKTRPRAAVVVTDGYIESVDPKLLRAIHGVRLHAILTREGSAAPLQRAGIPYTQLGRLPA